MSRFVLTVDADSCPCPDPTCGVFLRRGNAMFFTSRVCQDQESAEEAPDWAGWTELGYIDQT